MTIDSHQHFWRYDPIRYAWIDEQKAILKKDFLPAELWSIYQENAVDGCVAVQAEQSESETTFLIEQAAENDFIKGVVGWVDLRADQIAERLAHFAQFPKVKGFRHVVQDEQDHNFLLRPSFLRGIQALHAHKFTYDILIFPHQLGAALELIRLFPDQAFVIDHLAKPYIKDQFFDGWAVLMRSIAEFPNVSCKLSGMVTEANWKDWKYEDFLPYLNTIMEAFGTDRVMFGSDWPVCLLAGTYGEVKGIIDRFLDGSPKETKEAVMGLNAIKFYNL